MPYVGVPPSEVLVDPKPHHQQTYAVKGDKEAEAALRVFAQGCVAHGAGVWAIHKRPKEVYLVITLGPSS